MKQFAVVLLSIGLVACSQSSGGGGGSSSSPDTSYKSGACGYDVVSDYNIIHNELSEYSDILSHKIEIIALSKCDTIPESEAQEKLNQLEKFLGKKPMLLSSHSGAGINALLRKVTEEIDLFHGVVKE